MTIELGILRHADAGDPYAWTGDDALRPLSRKGRRQAERLGAFLRSVGYTPGLLITSPKLRARETADLVAEPFGVEVVVDDRLAIGFGLAELSASLAAVGLPQRPIIVGHDPDFSMLLADLCGGAEVPLRKGTYARVDLDEIAAGAGTLRWLIPPDLLKGG
jgi:phosphohistidine phosphatase SixA